ncbi:hypothetical protein GGS21DRAFT_95897 [Xylaria nigripes]|nr:hypothetical protein GGS21DRAFT_95897 [Xylaria nigripes]
MEGIAEDSLKECIWIIDGFVFLREFNPRLPDYDIAAVERYFFTDRMQRATEFLAWRKYFWPGQNRCDRCCIRLLSECVYAPGAAECGNCTLTGEQCAFTYETESPSNTQDQLPPDPFSPANPGPNTGGSMPPAAAQDKGKGIMNFSCVTCTHNNYDSCDMRPSLNYGCTNCRKLDVACQVYDSNAQSQILTPRPDGLLPPLCCDGCIHPPGGIHECSWRHIGSDESLPCDKCVVDDIMSSSLPAPCKSAGNLR